MPISHLLIDASVICIPLSIGLLLLFRRWSAALLFLFRLLFGWGALFLFAKYCSASGITLANNFFTVGIFGALGLPGLGLLLMLRFLFLI